MAKKEHKIKDESKQEMEDKKEKIKDIQEEKELGTHELKALIDAEKDRALRLTAEFDNYKKRTAKEIQDYKRFANETLLKQLLSVVDNLERAIDTAKQNKDDKGIIDGVKMTHKEILRIFESFEVKPLKSEGEIFDPKFHQAVTQEESESHPDNTIIKELQKGYTLHGRLIRPSMVIVSKKKSKETKNSEELTENTK